MLPGVAFRENLTCREAPSESLQRKKPRRSRRHRSFSRFSSKQQRADSFCLLWWREYSLPELIPSLLDRCANPRD
jgi:hypothetical protein